MVKHVCSICRLTVRGTLQQPRAGMSLHRSEGQGETFLCKPATPAYNFAPSFHPALVHSSSVFCHSVQLPKQLQSKNPPFAIAHTFAPRTISPRRFPTLKRSKFGAWHTQRFLIKRASFSISDNPGKDISIWLNRLMFCHSRTCSPDMRLQFQSSPGDARCAKKWQSRNQAIRFHQLIVIAP